MGKAGEMVDDAAARAQAVLGDVKGGLSSAQRQATGMANDAQAAATGFHRSREFIEFLKLVDAAYPAHTAIKLILESDEV